MLISWNELEHRRDRGETATEYTNRAIRALKRFARLHDVLVIVVADPTTAHCTVIRQMSLYDAKRSSHWVKTPDTAS